MIRTLTMLTVAACVAAPVLAGPRDGGSNSSRRDRTGGGMSAPSGEMGTPAGPYGWHERRIPAAVYYAGYRLTPREYYRLKAMGFTRDEVFMIADAAHATGLPTRVFEDAIYRGLYARQIGLEFGISPGDIVHVWPEWRTPEWAAATGEPVYTQDKLDVWY